MRGFGNFVTVAALEGLVMERAVFLDRDGTVSEEVGYIRELDRFQIYSYAPLAIRKLNQAGLRTFLVTNQSGVARGMFSEDLIHEIHTKLEKELREESAHLDAIYYCPHHPEGSVPSYRQDCNCRKPKTGMIQRAALDFDLDLRSSFVVGDKYLDMELAFRAGARAILVLSGYGHEQYRLGRQTWPRQPDYVAANLLEAAEWIVAEVQRECATD